MNKCFDFRRYSNKLEIILKQDTFIILTSEILGPTGELLPISILFIVSGVPLENCLLIFLLLKFPKIGLLFDIFCKVICCLISKTAFSKSTSS